MLDDKVIAKIESCWSDETAGFFDENNPPRNQCFVTSLLVNELLGGEFAFLDTPRHLWNILPSGEHLDLTRDQFKTKVDFRDYLVLNREEVFAVGNARTGDLDERFGAMIKAFREGQTTGV